MKIASTWLLILLLIHPLLINGAVAKERKKKIVPLSDFAKASEAFSKGNYRKAIYFYNRASNGNPDLKPSTYLGISHFALKEYDLAREYLNEAISKDPQDFQAYIYRGNLSKLEGNWTKALSDFMRATESFPKYPSPYFSIASLYYAVGDTKGFYEYRRKFENALTVEEKETVRRIREGKTLGINFIRLNRSLFVSRIDNSVSRLYPEISIFDRLISINSLPAEREDILNIYKKGKIGDVVKLVFQRREKVFVQHIPMIALTSERIKSLKTNLAALHSTSALMGYLSKDFYGALDAANKAIENIIHSSAHFYKCVSYLELEDFNNAWRSCKKTKDTAGDRVPMEYSNHFALVHYLKGENKIMSIAS